MITLREYIDLHYRGSQSEFARAEGVSRQHVHAWVSKNWIVTNDKLCSVKRTLNHQSTKKKGTV